MTHIRQTHKKVQFPPFIVLVTPIHSIVGYIDVSMAEADETGISVLPLGQSMLPTMTPQCFLIPAITMAFTAWMQEGPGGHVWTPGIPLDCLCYKQVLCSRLELTCFCSYMSCGKVITAIQRFTNT